MSLFFDFIFAIAAEVAAHYICKWLVCKIAKNDSKPTRQSEKNVKENH